MVQAYAPASSRNGQLVEISYENLESAISNVRIQYAVLMVGINAKVDEKQAG